MAVLGIKTLNEIWLLEIDADPRVGGIAAPSGSVAFMTDGSLTFSKLEGDEFEWIPSSGVAIHGDLSDLANDDHLQYLNRNGVRPMAGSLDMGNNAITNNSTINGVTVQTHASRHLPEGVDPLSTASPSSIGISNAEGSANSFARADHIHDHGNQTTPTHHAEVTSTANGFMSSTDKVFLDGVQGQLDNKQPASNPRSLVYFFDDFIAANLVGTLGWNVINSGAAASMSTGYTPGLDENAFGAWSQNTGTTSTGRSCLSTSSLALKLSQGSLVFSWRVRLQSVSDSTDQFSVFVGIGDNVTNGDMTDGVYFQYTDSLNGGNWTLKTAQNNTRTAMDSGVAVAAATWYTLRAVINQTATSAQFFINEVSVGTITSNLPGLGSGEETGFLAKIVKSNGTNNRILGLDYFYSEYKFSTLR